MQGFSLSSRVSLPAWAFQLDFSRSHSDVAADPTLPGSSNLALSGDTRIVLGSDGPALMFQADFAEASNSDPTLGLLSDQITQQTVLRVSQGLGPMDLSAFVLNKATRESVSASLSTLRQFGGQFNLNLGHFSALLQFGAEIIKNTAGLIISQNTQSAAELDFNVGSNSAFARWTQDKTGAELLAGLQLALGESSLTTLATIALPQAGSAQPALSLSLSSPFNLVLPGILAKGRITGIVFLDSNGNGRQDAGELGVSGLIVDINGLRLSTDRGAEGRFRSPPLFPGEYAIKIEDLPATLVSELRLPLSVHVRAGQTTRVALPLLQVASIGGTVFNDANRNGRRDPGEGGLANVTVRLISSTGQAFEARTGDEGRFLFANLPPAHYRVLIVTETLPQRFELTTPGQVSLELKQGEQIMLFFGAAKRARSIKFSPTADFSFTPQQPVVGETVRFDGSSSFDPDGRIVKYEWDFGDGSQAGGKIVAHTFASSGQFQVTLTVTDNDGNTGSKTKTIRVSAP